MNKITTLTLGVIFLTMGLTIAQQTPSTSQTATKAVEVGNKHCPVSGKEVGVMGPAFKVEYNGKVHNLCCPGCKSTFNSDPEKYSKIAEADAASQNK